MSDDFTEKEAQSLAVESSNPAILKDCFAEYPSTHRLLTLNPETPPSTLDHLANSLNPLHEWAVAVHPNARYETLKKLAKSPRTRTRFEASERVENWNSSTAVSLSYTTDVDRLRKAAVQGSLNEKLWAAQNRHMPPDCLDLLADADVYRLQVRVAMNLNTSAETLAKLERTSRGNHYEWRIRAHIALNPNTSGTTRDRILDDEHSRVKAAAISATASSFHKAKQALSEVVPPEYRIVESLADRDSWESPQVGSIAINRETAACYVYTGSSWSIFSEGALEERNTPTGYVRHKNGGGLVSLNAMVEDSVFVGPLALVEDFATIKGEVRVEDRAVVRNSCVIEGSVRIYDRAEIGGCARVLGNVQIEGRAQVKGNAVVEGEAKIGGCVQLLGYTTVSEGSLTGYEILNHDQSEEGSSTPLDPSPNTASSNGPPKPSLSSTIKGSIFNAVLSHVADAGGASSLTSAATAWAVPAVLNDQSPGSSETLEAAQEQALSQHVASAIEKTLTPKKEAH